MSQLFQTPFGRHSTTAEVIDGVDLSGQRAIVTGAGSGIGVETARAWPPPAQKLSWQCGARRQPDVRFDRLRLVIEFDGFAFHTDHAAFEYDRQRQNAFVKNGWTVLRFTWRQLTQQPESVVADIRATIDLITASVQSAGESEC